MKSMNYYLVGAGLVLAILLYSFITNGIGFTSGYKFLFRKIYSQENTFFSRSKPVYELTPLIQADIYKPNYFYLPALDQYLVKSSIEFTSEIDPETGWSHRRKSTKRYVLLNNHGQIKDSFDTDINFSRFSGIFFGPDSYIDWIESGSTEPKHYSQIVNADLSLSAAEFVQAFQDMRARADYMEYVYLRVEGGKYEAGVVFKKESQWSILVSGTAKSFMNEQTVEENPKTGIWDRPYRLMTGYYVTDIPPSAPLMQLVPLESDIGDPSVFRNYPGVGDIRVKKFEKTGSESIFEVSGTAYVSVKINQSIFKFKIPDVLKVSIWPIYNLGVRTFKLPETKNENSLVFLEITQNAGSMETRREGLGVYVVTKLKGEESPRLNDLPESITERRFAHLPIPLQKALINHKTTRELEIKEDVKQWLPEIELLENLVYLKIQGGLTELPESISKLENLQVLDLSMNKLKQLPVSFSQLKKLRYLYLSFTDLQSFPDVLLSLPELRKLDLGHNFFTEIPAKINKLDNLIELDLSGSKITSMPDSMADMKELTISTGQYTEFHKKFPKKFQHLFVNKLPSYLDHLNSENTKNLESK